MSSWKTLLLNVYYYGSYPHRAWRIAQARAGGRSPVMVLFYHRIADDRATPWTTSNLTFGRQMRWLKRHFDMVSLAEAQRRLKSGANDRPCVAITFDDGYADNCHFALPLLVEQRIPCTYFVSTRQILEGVAFPHDVARGRPLAPNTPEEICRMAAAGIEIGAHSRTHADLGPTIDRAQLYDELVVARQELQDLTGSPVDYFAFPYGQNANLSPMAFQLARIAGYKGVCSGYGGFNFPGDDAFHLQRIHVDDDMIRLKNWTSVDPRKVRSIRRYEYEDAKVEVAETVAQVEGACA